MRHIKKYVDRINIKYAIRKIKQIKLNKLNTKLQGEPPTALPSAQRVVSVFNISQINVKIC